MPQTGDPKRPRAALLLVGHGTRVPEGALEMERLLAELRERHAAPVEHCWLEDFAEPDAATAAAALARTGAERVVALPFLNFAAYHARSDVPEQVREAADAQPSLRFTVGRVLGHHRALLELAERRVHDALSGERPGPDDVLVVAASGSSDPDSNGDVAKAARLLAERTGHHWVEHAFAGVTWPSPDEALRRAKRAGAARAVLFSWSLLAGLLERKVSEQARAVSDETGLRVLDAGRFGPDPLVAEAVMDRFREAATAAFPWD
jgi:sirohydrochlorin cobaltochelatase